MRSLRAFVYVMTLFLIAVGFTVGLQQKAIEQMVENQRQFHEDLTALEGRVAEFQRAFPGVKALRAEVAYLREEIAFVGVMTGAF